MPKLGTAALLIVAFPIGLVVYAIGGMLLGTLLWRDLLRDAWAGRSLGTE